MVDGPFRTYYGGGRGTSRSVARDGQRLTPALDRALRDRRGPSAVGNGKAPGPGPGRDQVGDPGRGGGPSRGAGHGGRPGPGAGGPAGPRPPGVRALRGGAGHGHAAGGDRLGARPAGRRGRGEAAPLAQAPAGAAVRPRRGAAPRTWRIRGQRPRYAFGVIRLAWADKQAYS